MLNINDSLQALRGLGMNEEEVQKFKELFEPQIEFHKYLMEKLSLSSEDTEKLTQEYSKNFIEHSIKKLKDDGVNIATYDTVSYFIIAGASFKNLALENGYSVEDASNLENCIVEIAKEKLMIQERIVEMEKNLKK